MSNLISKPKGKLETFLENIIVKGSTIITIAIGMLLLGFFIMLLWNYLFPDLFGLPAIKYWQGVAMGLLARLLFGFT